SVDDAKKIQIFEGNVLMTKGTLMLQSEKIVITEDEFGFQKAVAFGGKNGLAHFRQKKEGKEEYIEGEAERLEYQAKDEVTELFHQAWIKNGEDQIKSDYIWYENISEKYLAKAKLQYTDRPSRVRMMIIPKKKSTNDPNPGILLQKEHQISDIPSEQHFDFNQSTK
ncbi:MAG TPA: lipopolysaccharide transport periplasmic protein LptA, partial [Ignavibacteriaceae bacterium]